MEFLNGHFQAWKSHGKNLDYKSFGKVMEICYNHMFIHAEFEIMNILKKDAQNISRHTLSYWRRNFLFFLRVASERTLTGKFAGHSSGSKCLFFK